MSRSEQGDGGGFEEAREARLGNLLDAYGADPARWPVDERIEMVQFIHASANLRARLAEAQALDLALDSAVHASVSEGLASRVLAGFDAIAARPSVRRFINVAANLIWPGAPMWQPSTALAVSLVVGLVLGVMSPLGRQAQISRDALTPDISVAFAPPVSDNDGDP